MQALARSDHALELVTSAPKPHLLFAERDQSAVLLTFEPAAVKCGADGAADSCFNEVCAGGTLDINKKGEQKLWH